MLAEFDREPDGFLYAFVILEPREDFWGIDFPAPHTAEEALARLLMECSFCQRREVVYLNELQLKSFEVRRCVARLCTHCDAPSIWIEAQSETRQEGVTPKPAPMEEHVNPHRKKNRVKVRVLACIRRRGFQEEVAVCGAGKSMPQKSSRGSKITKAYRNPSGSRSNSASTRARAIFLSSPFCRRSVSSCPGNNFSARHKTPPLRLTSSVCAVCLTATPPVANHDASTGIRRLTRSLCRSPSERIASIRRKCRDFQTSMQAHEERNGHGPFVVPTNNAPYSAQAVPQRYCCFGHLYRRIYAFLTIFPAH